MSRIAVGLSGGVDSSVAAYLLKEAGHEVIGFHLKLTDEINPLHGRACCSLDASNDARLVAADLGISFYVLNQKSQFKQHVIEPFISEYQEGLTPNPCIFCNKHIKFGSFLKKAKELGCEYLATGHYAKILEEEGRIRIKKSKDPKKDQTYMLYTLSQEQLKHIIMPLGDIDNKEKVRQIAMDLNLYASDRADSQDICFVEDNDYVGYLKNQGVPFIPGEFVLDGKIIGHHKGLPAYTIGQRKGLGISYSEALFVKGFLRSKNQVILCRDSELYSSTLQGTSFNAIFENEDVTNKELECKIRYSTKTYPCLLNRNGSDFTVHFFEPIRAITPGQSVVFYHDDYLYGGGVIV